MCNYCTVLWSICLNLNRYLEAQLAKCFLLAESLLNSRVGMNMAKAPFRSVKGMPEYLLEQVSVPFKSRIHWVCPESQICSLSFKLYWQQTFGFHFYAFTLLIRELSAGLPNILQVFIFKPYALNGLLPTSVRQVLVVTPQAICGVYVWHWLWFSRNRSISLLSSFLSLNYSQLFCSSSDHDNLLSVPHFISAPVSLHCSAVDHKVQYFN